MRHLVGLLFATVICVANAQNVINADSFSFQPNLIRDAGGFKSCGARAVVAIQSGNESSMSYDFSVNVYNDAIALMKAGQQSMPFIKGRGWDTTHLHVTTPGPETFWLGLRDNNLTLKPAKYVASNDVGYAIGGVDTPDALRIIFAMIANEPMQVALHFPGQKFEKIIAFQPNVSEADRATVQACMGGLVERMKIEHPEFK